MTKRALTALLAAAVVTTVAGGVASGGHSARATNTAAPPALLVAPAASLSLGSLLSHTRDHALPAMNAERSHTGTRATGGAAGKKSAPKSSDASKSRRTNRTKTVQVHSHYTEPPGTVDGAQCRGLVVSTPDCQYHYVGTSTYTGTMWGDETFELTGWVTPDGRITYSGHAIFTGGIVGCGTGTYSFDGEGATDMTRFDPVTHGAPGYFNWRLRPGGTGQLTNLVSGQGEIVWTDYFVEHNGDTNKSGEGDVTGTITCRI